MHNFIFLCQRLGEKKGNRVIVSILFASIILLFLGIGILVLM